MYNHASQQVHRLPRDAGESSVTPVAIVLLVAIALLAGTNVYTLLQLKEFRLEVSEQFSGHEERLALLDGNVARTSTELETQVGEVKSLVESAEKQIDVKTRQVENKVLSRAQVLEEELEATRETSEAKITEVGGKLAEYQEVTKTQVGALDGRVETVKKEVDETRAELEKTIAELTSVKGDLGVQSGLIATNGTELSALKRLGERNYYEFNLGKAKEPQRVGPISIKLTGTDRKRNRFSIELWADDRKVEKRRKTLLEPVQFYVEGVPIPYELVINKIDQGLIAGYLATPKTGPRGGS